MASKTFEPPAGGPASVVSYEHSDVDKPRPRKRSNAILTEPVPTDVVARAKALFSSIRRPTSA